MADKVEAEEGRGSDELAKEEQNLRRLELASGLERIRERGMGGRRERERRRKALYLSTPHREPRSPGPFVWQRVA